MMPWSDHLNAIMAIFDELLAVDASDTYNISFSNFEIFKIDSNGSTTTEVLTFKLNDDGNAKPSTYAYIRNGDVVHIKANQSTTESSTVIDPKIHYSNFKRNCTPVKDSFQNKKQRSKTNGLGEETCPCQV